MGVWQEYRNYSISITIYRSIIYPISPTNDQHNIPQLVLWRSYCVRVARRDHLERSRRRNKVGLEDLAEESDPLIPHYSARRDYILSSASHELPKQGVRAERGGVAYSQGEQHHLNSLRIEELGPDVVTASARDTEMANKYTESEEWSQRRLLLR